jgi:hypothetical protein
MHIEQWKGCNVRFETRKDGRVWGCLSDMADATDKRFSNWLRLDSTQEYLQALSTDLSGKPKKVKGFSTKKEQQDFSNILQVNQGGLPDQQGTWAIDEVVMDFAQWCNVDFRIWANRVLRNVITQGYHVEPEIKPQQALEALCKVFTRLLYKPTPDGFKQMEELAQNLQETLERREAHAMRYIRSSDDPMYEETVADAAVMLKNDRVYAKVAKEMVRMVQRYALEYSLEASNRKFEASYTPKGKRDNEREIEMITEQLQNFK